MKSALDQRSKTMKLFNNKIIFVIISLGLGVGLLASPFTHAGELDFNDEQNAKVSRFKAKGRVLKNKLGGNEIVENVEADIESGLEDESKCGVVDIGNVTDSKPFGAPRQVDIIITGDVINAGNKCK